MRKGNNYIKSHKITKEIRQEQYNRGRISSASCLNVVEIFPHLKCCDCGSYFREKWSEIFFVLELSEERALERG
ncbi:hypothetical protein HR09_08615 [Porphyromonas gulae]|nr:hypothetical protein HR09_08615 [Porphyromonas gulae]